MTPQPQPRPPVKVPEWLRRMREGKHPAKDMTKVAA